METCRTLIISGHPLFAEAITHLLREGGVEVVATAGSLDAAVPWLREQPVEAIIVDHDDPQLRDAEVVSRLVGHDEDRQVIFLTLSGNQMIVHHRERVEDVTAADLVGAIRAQR